MSLKPPASSHRYLAALALSLSLGAAALPATAAEGPMDFLFGSSGQAPRNQAVWKYGEFSALRLVEREDGASPNEHPVRLEPASLINQLASVEFDSGKGRMRPLFSRDELEELAPQLSQALAQARPDQDLLLASSARREGGALSLPQTLTARLFARQGELQLIVQQARADLLSQFRSTRLTPRIEFGSRRSDSGVRLQTSAGRLARGDWIRLPLTAGAPGMAAVMPGAASTAAAVTAPVQPPTATAPTRPTRDEAFYAAQGQRLSGLLQLREQKLLSEEEFQRKRKEIIDGL